MPVNTEGKHEDKGLPWISLIPFSKAQAHSAALIPLSLAGTCARTRQKPRPLGGSRELPDKGTFRIQVEGPLGGIGLWDPGWQ